VSKEKIEDMTLIGRFSHLQMTSATTLSADILRKILLYAGEI